MKRSTSAAAKVLSDPKASRRAKSAAALALTQRQPLPMSDWVEASKFPHKDYEFVLMAVPNYEEDKLLHRIGMWYPENDQWVVFGANWHPQPTHVKPLDPLPRMSAKQIKSAAKLSIYSASKDRAAIKKTVTDTKTRT